MVPKVATSFRLPRHTVVQLRKLGQRARLSQAQVLERLVESAHEQLLPPARRGEVEEEAERAIAEG